MTEYNPQYIESKWQRRWLDENLFAAQEDPIGKKMYVLDMFPYPSGDGLHVGHTKIYTASDVASRYLRMKGFNVLHPTGWDAFGLPTENTAIKKKVHPRELTKRNTDRFRKQMQAMGFSYDWQREINTTDPEYMKWTQWIFLQLYRMGLAYEDTIPINWCPSCKTGLANEEVVEGKCDRCGHIVEIKPMRQWMLRITKYAQQLLTGLDKLDWPQFIKELQHNWIGKSEGTNIKFPISIRQLADQFPIPERTNELEVFTTRPDTLFGVTYIVLSPDHPLVLKITTPEQKLQVEAYVAEASKPVRLAMEAEGDKEKTGVFTGGYAIHPVTGEQVPIWVADYVLMSYGSGAVMAVPAHDERDFEFAQKYQLPIKPVVVPSDGNVLLPYTGEGMLQDSGQFTGQKSEMAKDSIAQKLQLSGAARRAVHYKLRDWVFSRQRYWGEPIPIIHCEKCGIVPVPEADLPVLLPEIESYEPTGTGESPLAKAEDWVRVKCPTCPNIARRETNTMPQWAGSSWYWLRYTDPYSTDVLARPNQINKWLPVDLYIGGAEHAVLHLLYARFWQMALSDARVVPEPEPFKRFRAVGLVLGEDGQKMSKSRGNVINPDEVILQYGADTLRVYEMFMGPFEHAAPWNTDSMRGPRRFLERVWEYVELGLRNPTSPSAVAKAMADERLPAFAKASAGKRGTSKELGTDGDDVRLALHQTIRRVSEGIENFKFNVGVAAMMEFLNTIQGKQVSKDTLSTFVLLLAPYAPHTAEELWEKLGHAQSLMYEKWPEFDLKVIGSAEVTIPVQVNGKVRGELILPRGASQAQVEHMARAEANVSRYLQDKQIHKVVFVADRLINFVVG